MGPPLNSGGDRCRLQRGEGPMSSFNGAAAEQRRRLGDIGARATNESSASMGPPLNSGGDVARACDMLADADGFNGAAAEQRRRRRCGVGAMLAAYCSSFNGAAAEQRRRRLDAA